MYAHGQGAIVLCEAYAMTGDEMLREPAQRAIDFIVEAQHPAGGWRYRPGEPGDTSVLGWQVMALRIFQSLPTNALAGLAKSSAVAVQTRANHFVAWGTEVKSRPGSASTKR